ncbi:MAG: TonB-dependent receptor, partial [Pseudomonadota bacterium]
MLAQAPGDDEGGAVQLDTITVEGIRPENSLGPVDGYLPSRTTTGTRIDAPIEELPLSIQSIPREVIEDTNADRLSDVIGFATGAATGNAFGDTNDAFLFRGFAAQIATDGAATGSLNAGIRQRDSVNLERVEVLRGPASALYGQGAPGGVINLVRKRPFDNFAARFDTSMSSFTRLRHEVDINVPLSETGNVNARLVAAIEGTDSFQLRDFTDPFPETRVVFAPSLSFSPTTNTEVVLNTEYVRDASFFDRGLPLAEDGGFLVDIDQTFADTDVGNTITNTIVANAEISHRFSDAISVRLFGGVDYNDFEGTQSEVALLSPFDVPDPLAGFIGLPQPLVEGETILRELEFRDFENTNYNIQADLNLSFSTGPLSHDAILSVEYARAEEDDFVLRSDLATQFDVTSISTPNEPTALSLDDLPVVTDRLATSEAIGLVAFDKISWGERVHLLLGGRVDFLDQSEVNGIGDDPEPVKETEFSPRAGVVVKPLDALPLSAFFSYGESFEANSELTASGALLPPQEGRVFEGGLRYGFNEDRLALTITAFDISLENAPLAVEGTAFSTTSTQTAVPLTSGQGFRG